ncbi:MAG TPA: glycosyltransferase family 9 protein, partial [Abditibacteriaceae bacterium]
ASLDIAPDAAERFFPRLPMTATHRRLADEFLTHAGINADHKIVVLNLGASVPQNRWPAERFAILANNLLAADDEIRIVVTGATQDAHLLERFEAQLALTYGEKRKKSVPGAMVNAVGTTLSGNAWPGRVLTAVGRIDLLQLAAVAERASAFVTADTGPMHIAAAAGAPVLALFGPANAAGTGPVHKPGNAPIHVLDARDVTGHWPAPMEALEVGAVESEVLRLICDAASWRKTGGVAPSFFVEPGI